MQRHPYLWATHVWNLFDFAADGRDEGGKNGQNQKGLVEFDHKTRKDAFYLYKAAWSKEPFVHLCGRRYRERAEEETVIKVYSNQEEVTLFVDDQEIGTLQGKNVFCFTVPITGTHKITAVSGSLKDQMDIVRVDEPNPDYRFGKAGDVVNWFDKIEIDPAFYSIKDKFGELMKNPGTASVVGKIMAKARASRGDVAKSTTGNKVLEQMLAAMPFEAILKQAGANVIPQELIRSINDMLQKVRKE
ncbi:MAG: hypothetical protein ACSW8K_00475 [bacterium]